MSKSKTKEELLKETKLKKAKLEEKKEALLLQIRREDEKIRLLYKEMKTERVKQIMELIDSKGIDLDAVLKEIQHKN